MFSFKLRRLTSVLATTVATQCLKMRKQDPLKDPERLLVTPIRDIGERRKA